MSETKNDNQENSLNSNTFDDEDDLWALQSDKKNNSTIDFDGFDDDEKTTNPPPSINLEEVEENVEPTPAEKPLKLGLPLERVNEEPLTEKIVMTPEQEITSAQEINQLENDLASSLNELETKTSESEINPSLANVKQDFPTEQNTTNSQEAVIVNDLNKLVKSSLRELEEKRENLEKTIVKLETRRDKIQQEINSTFAGASQNLAIRVQGFKDYLVGSLQDLAVAAEQLDLPVESDNKWEIETQPVQSVPETTTGTPEFAQKNFGQEKKEIRRLLDQYRSNPDYYGPPWQLRRTFEPVHAEKVADWFFNQGGRGALSSMSSRLQNILIGSAIISVLSHLYGNRSRVLILADTPEKLGEWRRGLQDCLGISRSDFGPNRGVILFETSIALSKKGDRIVEEGDLPLVIMDLDDDRVSLSLLKFPLWLAFAPESPMQSSEYYY